MEILKHECGVALIRLLKPLEYYQEKYGTWMYGLNKLYLLMEKQHNRGQEAAGLACVKLQADAGEEYMFRERALGAGAITEIFGTVHSHFKDLTEEQLHDAEYAKKCLPFAGELYMGHLRYSTTGKSGISYVHPFLRRNNWRAKNLALCGNFNLTNVDEIFADITAAGQHPRKYADTYIMLEQVGHRLDREVERLYNICKEEGLQGMDITHAIEDRIDLTNVLKTSSSRWDGGYVICGLTGSGESFAIRDPWGIRPAFWYMDDEIMVLASERPVIQTVLNVSADNIRELQPGQAILVNKKGEMRLAQINRPKNIKPCSFERIYFSRGSDMDIYRERKRLGELLVRGAGVWVQEQNAPKRKTRFSLIAVEKDGVCYNIDSQAPNLLAREWLESGRAFPGSRITEIRPEQKYGNSRFDLAFCRDGKKALMEVKGVTLNQNGAGLFPDAPTLWGEKHVHELIACRRDGYEAYLLFVVILHKFL